MKISFKIPAVAALGGLVLCAGVLSAYASGADSENEYTVGDYYVSGAEHPIYEKYKDHGLPKTHYYAVGEKPEYLTEYPEEFLPYVEEMERINAELGTDYVFSIEVSEAEELINFYTSMTIEEFRDFIYGAYENDMANPLPFDEYAIPETADTNNVNIEYVGIMNPEDNPREYPEEFLPYIEEMERFNAEHGTEYDYYHLTNEAIDRILLMSIEEFRDSLCGGDTTTEAADSDNVNVEHVKVSDYGYIKMDDGTEVPARFLTEYPEEFLPYVEELEHINEELGTDYEFAILDAVADEYFDFYLSMSIEEFRDYFYGAYNNDIADPLPFDEYAVPETVETACSDIPDTATKITGQIVAPDGTVYSWDEISFLTEDEYPDEFMPYVEELNRINEELGTDFKFAIMDFTVDECMDFYLSMSIEEFRDYIINVRYNCD